MQIRQDITGSKFEIKLERRRGWYRAATVAEVVAAVGHYFSKDHDWGVCPLCRSIREENTKGQNNSTD